MGHTFPIDLVEKEFSMRVQYFRSHYQNMDTGYLLQLLMAQMHSPLATVSEMSGQAASRRSPCGRLRRIRL